jgi:hypothetical protein
VGLKQLAQRESKPRASIHAVSCKPRGAAGSLAVALEGKSETSGGLFYPPHIKIETTACGGQYCPICSPLPNGERIVAPRLLP